MPDGKWTHLSGENEKLEKHKTVWGRVSLRCCQSAAKKQKKNLYKIKRFLKLHSKQTRELESVQKAAFESHPALNTHWPAASVLFHGPFCFSRALERSLKNAGGAATSLVRVQMSCSRGLLIFPFQLNEDSSGKKTTEQQQGAVRFVMNKKKGKRKRLRRG